MEPVHVRKASQRAHYEYQHYDLVKRHESLLIWYNVKTPRLSGNLTRFEEGAAGKYAGRQRKMRSEGASEARGHVSARRGIQPVTPGVARGREGSLEVLLFIAEYPLPVTIRAFNGKRGRTVPSEAGEEEWQGDGQEERGKQE